MNEHSTIPKILHYVWVGGNPQSKLIQKCIQSWKRYAPEYEVRFWNEENAPMQHPYVQEMYRQKKWAFVSDYIRFWALEKEGGIYLDTDMELLQSLDTFLSQEVFVGRSKSGNVESSIIGSVPHHPFIQAVLHFYDTDTTFSIANTSPRVLEKTLEQGMFSHVQIYGSKYFHPCNEGEACDPRLLTQAYARHHWAESWVPFKTLRKILRRLGVLSSIKQLLNCIRNQSHIKSNVQKHAPYAPFVSVAITTYNGGKFIVEQVESILNQTYQNIEVVISDDGSNEETIAILDGFVKKDNRVRWSRNPQQRGFIKNTENAIALCKGDIIFLCDQDDTWYPEKIELHIKEYENPNVTWVYNRLVLTDENNNTIGYIEDTLPDYYRHKTMLENAWGSCIGGAQTSYRAELLKKTLPVDVCAPAHDSWIQLVLNPARGVFIDKILQTYRQHSGNEVGFRTDFSREELLEREARAIRDNIKYLRSLSKNRVLSVQKRIYFYLVYVAKKIRAITRKLFPFIKVKSFITS